MEDDTREDAPDPEPEYPDEVTFRDGITRSPLAHVGQCACCGMFRRWTPCECCGESGGG